eukprot:gb/GFBE01023985.1/.p1 GENE.gb/GFBE01023985.1/~~gb/GFBE01023985.1/.p1  ORF type:complete len:507 (+),score=124.10 gb/GFBE01023985.1/:1-1521(+)
MVRLVAVAAAALLAGAAGSEECSAVSTRGATLMQVNSEVGKSTDELLRSRARASAGTKATSSIAARQAQQFLEDPANISAALKKGLEGIRSAIRHFQAEPADIAGGVSVLGATLLECIDMVITEAGKSGWPEYDEFQETWRKRFEDLPTALAGAQQDLEQFAANGKINHLVSAVSQILSQASDVVLDLVPEDLGKEISGYIETLNKAFAALGEAVREFEDGDTVGGVEAIYWGLRNATESLVPPSLQTDPTYATIIGTLDSLVGGMAQDVLDYKRRLMESGTCWKISKSRARRHPKVCAEGYVWDGERHCWPEAEAKCYAPAEKCVSPFEYKGQTYTNCTRANHNRMWCAHDVEYKTGRWSRCTEVPCESSLLHLSTMLDKATSQKHPKGTVPAACDDSESSEFPEKTGGWCYADCPAGYEAHGSKCWTSCEGQFPADSALMCGKDQGVLTATITEMVTVTLHSAFSLGTVIGSMQDAGVNADSLGSTIQIFVDMGKPFALPKCSA